MACDISGDPNVDLSSCSVLSQALQKLPKLAPSAWEFAALLLFLPLQLIPGQISDRGTQGDHRPAPALRSPPAGLHQFPVGSLDLCPSSSEPDRASAL